MASAIEKIPLHRIPSAIFGLFVSGFVILIHIYNYDFTHLVENLGLEGVLLLSVVISVILLFTLQIIIIILLLFLSFLGKEIPNLEDEQHFLLSTVLGFGIILVAFAGEWDIHNFISMSTSAFLFFIGLAAVIIVLGGIIYVAIKRSKLSLSEGRR